MAFTKLDTTQSKFRRQTSLLCQKSQLLPVKVQLHQKSKYSLSQNI